MLSDMDTLSFDGYTSYSDSSTSAPRTPSPRSDTAQIYLEDGAPNSALTGPGVYRGSLMQELYGHEQQQPNDEGYKQPQPLNHPHIPRRATFPYVRHDAATPPNSYPSQYPHEQYIVPSNGPQGYYGHGYLPQQQQYGPPPGVPLPSTYGTLNAHGGIGHHLPPPLPIQHTDDAASKETQYLRRRCFNCHTTEPPSWRRSTLNPGKIVCNKCGLYERTHLRPRPLRFDELRAGGKARKGSVSNGSAAPTQSAKTSPKSPAKLVKKESVDVGLGGYGRMRGSRRSSVSSSAGSASDWDDNVSSGYNSPASMLHGGHQPLPSVSPRPPHLAYDYHPSDSSYAANPHPNDGYNVGGGYANPDPNDSYPHTQHTPSPPSSAGIRLPNAPFEDLNLYQHQQRQEYERVEYEYDHGHGYGHDSQQQQHNNSNPHSSPNPSLDTYSYQYRTDSPYLSSVSPSLLGGSPSPGPGHSPSPVPDSNTGSGSSSSLPPSLSPSLLQGSISGAPGVGRRDKSHTISTSTPFSGLAYRERERSDSVSSIHSASSLRSAHSQSSLGGGFSNSHSDSPRLPLSSLSLTSNSPSPHSSPMLSSTSTSLGLGVSGRRSRSSSIREILHESDQGEEEYNKYMNGDATGAGAGGEMGLGLGLGSMMD